MAEHDVYAFNVLWMDFEVKIIYIERTNYEIMKRKIIINKFGGGILKPALMPFIEARLREQIKAGFSPVAVVSALPGVTDVLLAKAKGKSDAAVDKIVSEGERESAKIFAAHLTGLGLKAIVVDAEGMIVTDDNFGNANIMYPLSEKNVQKKLANISAIPVIPGFIGRAKDGKTTTLGRGGTDTTACFVGASLRAAKVVLWKDVGGVLSADPRIVSEARTISSVSYQEAEEAGKIIHDKAIQYVKMHKTPVEIASLADPRQKTMIAGSKKNPKKGAKIVSAKKNLMFFQIIDEAKKGSELLALVSHEFSSRRVDVILISNTRYSLQIVADNANGRAEDVFRAISKKVFNIEMFPVSMVFLVGNFGVDDVNAFNTLLIKEKADMEVSAFLYKNCTRLEAVVRDSDVERLVRALHKKFIK